jgi:hypothetical protein
MTVRDAPWSHVSALASSDQAARSQRDVHSSGSSARVWSTEAPVPPRVPEREAARDRSERPRSMRSLAGTAVAPTRRMQSHRSWSYTAVVASAKLTPQRAIRTLHEERSPSEVRE